MIDQSMTRREREIADIVYRLGTATAADIEAEMENPPSNATIRYLLRVLEEKQLLTHEKQGRRFVYKPAQSMVSVKESAINHLVRTFFQGSPLGAITAILKSSEIEAKELDALSELIEKAKEEGR